MTCPGCQTENREGERFCRECGATFGAVCAGCGAGVEAGSKFCDRCGPPLAARHGFRGSYAQALWLLGDTRPRLEPPDVAEAESHYGRALALADELGMRPLVAHCHLGLGKLYRGTGDHARAEAHLTSATTMYRELDMGLWLEKATVALGPPHGRSPL